MAVSDIDIVLERLGVVVAEAKRNGDRSGYFAAMYRKVTLAIREAVVTGRFEDGERLARLDRVFAERYLDAHDQWRSAEQTTAAWRQAFAATRRWRPLIIQHLLVGMNAHINLDLGVAAASVAPGSTLPSLRNDFDTINRVLAGLVDGFMDDVDEVSPWIGFLDRIGGRTDQAVVRFSIEIARRQAWALAEQLAVARPDQWAGIIESRDRATAGFTRPILHPGPQLSSGLLLIRLRESNDVPDVIDVLGD
jgi:hypothetical protein